MMRYAILEKTTFPGIWQHIPRWQLQDAEYALNFNRRAYYERATRIQDAKASDKDLILYSYEDAMTIVTYWQQNMSHAEFKVLGVQL